MKKKENILVVTQWSYKDALVQAYTLPYLKIISNYLSDESKIFLVTFEQDKLKMSFEETQKIKFELLKNKIELINFSYSSFGIISIIKYFSAFVSLFLKIFSIGITTIHCFGAPAGMMGYLLSILSGRRLILDSYEPHAEAMVENNTWKAGGFKFRVLFYFEKKMSRHAKIFIAAAKGMRDYAKEKYHVTIEQFFVKPACTDLQIFTPEKRKNASLLRQLSLDEKIVCVYAGKFGGIYLTKEVFDFFHQAELMFGNNFRALLLTPNSKKELDDLARSSSFDSSKMIVQFVPHEMIADYMGLADFAITPVKPVPTKRYCTPIKDGEYWGLGLPVVITKDISDDSSIIEKENAGAVISSLTPEEYKSALKKIKSLLTAPDLAGRIHLIAEKYRSFQIAENIYKEIYGQV